MSSQEKKRRFHQAVKMICQWGVLGECTSGDNAAFSYITDFNIRKEMRFLKLSQIAPIRDGLFEAITGSESAKLHDAAKSSLESICVVIEELTGWHVDFS